MPAEIRQFFDAYRDAFNRLDGRAVSAFYQVPSMISSASGPGLFTDAESLIANNEKLCEIYRDTGFARTEYREGAAISQCDNFFAVDLEWTIHRAQQAPQVFNTTYQLVRREAGGAWKIEHVAAYSEKRAWLDHE
jgi:ketosteroid isomerase-like protein